MKPTIKQVNIFVQDIGHDKHDTDAAAPKHQSLRISQSEAAENFEIYRQNEHNKAFSFVETATGQMPAQSNRTSKVGRFSRSF